MLECRVTSVPQSSTKRVKTNECLWEALKKAFFFGTKSQIWVGWVKIIIHSFNDN